MLWYFDIYQKQSQPNAKSVKTVNNRTVFFSFNNLFSIFVQKASFLIKLIYLQQF